MSTMAPEELDPAVVRDWARQQGIDVSDRGRVSQSLRRAYDEAHAAPSYEDGMTELDFGDDDGDTAAAGPPPPGDEKPPAETRPRTIKAPRGRPGWRGRLGKPKPKTARAKARPKHPRVPVAGLISDAWRLLAQAARPIPPTSRVLQLQAPVAGKLLEDVVKDTFLDAVLQPIARMEERGKVLFALAGPPALTTAITVNPQAAPFLLPVLRRSLIEMWRVAGPAMAEAMAEEAKFEEEFGAGIDAIIGMLFAGVLGPAADGEAADPGAAEEDEKIRQAQQVLGGMAPA